LIFQIALILLLQDVFHRHMTACGRQLLLAANGSLLGRRGEEDFAFRSGKDLASLVSALGDNVAAKRVFPLLLRKDVANLGDDRRCAGSRR
jgi:hypothetical protein